MFPGVLWFWVFGGLYSLGGLSGGGVLLGCCVLLCRGVMPGLVLRLLVLGYICVTLFLYGFCLGLGF